MKSRGRVAVQPHSEKSSRDWGVNSKIHAVVVLPPGKEPPARFE